ncbi:hypothetical protein FBU59_000142 [Linderina macrospora]|uniref:Uncharacterized protein n=1 Tax=Linderina macrospora TaxID=4868 RepID=A0ACC1JHU7_9FUNG|nr:hypothetical protein FBU59_000142 [Linderina macrospora]
MSTKPSPLFTPLNPSPQLVAQMTGLTLEQSELEVRQQHNLKRMLRRIRTSRRPTQPQHKRHSSLKHQEDRTTSKSSSANSDWDDIDDAGLSLRKMSVTIDIQDAPTGMELSRRVAKLFNSVFEPLEPIDGESVTVTRISGALTNCVYMVAVRPAPVASAHSSQVYTWVRESKGPRRANRTELPSKYLLRVYGVGVDEMISRDKELYWLSQLSSLGFGPRLFGIFGNGRLEEFLESETLTKEDIKEPWTSKHIARRMCELHSLVSYYRPFGAAQPAAAAALPNVDLSGAPELWTNLERWLPLVQQKWTHITKVCARNPDCTQILDTWSQLTDQLIPNLKAQIDAANSPVVFAHDDLQYGNILRLHGTDELVVVDFEYAGYNYRGFDLANHFCEWMADYGHPVNPHQLCESAYPDAAQRHAFLRTYVKAKAFLDANMCADKEMVVSDHPIQLTGVELTKQQIDEEVAVLEREIHPFVAASHLHWGVWGLLQACASEIDFDYVGYAAQRLGIFKILMLE